MQTQDGQITEPYSISAGLDYPGVGPMHANLYKSGRGKFISIEDNMCVILFKYIKCNILIGC